MSPRLPPFADQVRTPLLLHDPETGTICDANAAAAALYGYDLAGLRGLEVESFSAESPRFSQEEAERRVRAAAAGEEQSFQWQVRRRTGELRWVRVTLRPLALDGEVLVLAEMRDITTLKQRSRRLRLLHRILRHNLRNDMTVVQGYARGLLSALPDSPSADSDAEAQRQRAERIADAATDVAELTDSVARIEEMAEAGDHDRTPTEVTGLLEELAREFEARHPAATVSVAGEEDIRVSADRELRIAFEQALENAVEHAEGPPTVEIETSVESAEDRARVRITDGPPGIPSMEVEALDESRETTAMNHGTGVGLFVMKWCAESLGGTLDIESGEDGNLVEFVFPLYEGEPPPEDGVAV